MAIKNSIDKSENMSYDICIVGSGPAGLTLCKELENTGKRICVIESGGLIKNPENNKLRETVNTGEIKIKDSSRERIFGGASTTWSGLSAPLDKIDLEKWSISHDELYKYYKRLDKYGFARIEEFDSSSLSDIKKDADFKLGSNILNEKIFIAKDPAWNFGKELRYIFDKINIDLFTNSTVTHLSSVKNDSSTMITDVVIRNLNGNEYKINAKIFILAVGGIECPRLLLLSGLGNENDQVGRYITNHPKNNFGIIKLNKPAKNLTYLFGYLHSGWSKSAGIRVSEDLQKSLGILNSYVRLEPMFPWTDSAGVSNFLIIIKKFKLFLDWWKKKQKKVVNLRDWGETGDDENSANKFSLFISIIKIIKDFPSVFSYIIHRLFQKKKMLVKSIRLRNFMEMEARSENRITLSSNTDKNGKQLPEVVLNTSKLDRHSVVELHRIIGEEMKKRNIGVLQSNLKDTSPWPINSEASHHLGGTIMGNDPLKSVVNTDLKVHSVDNLYICSGSVFPTSGCANPTYTICALAVKLGDRIKKITQ